MRVSDHTSQETPPLFILPRCPGPYCPGLHCTGAWCLMVNRSSSHHLIMQTADLLSPSWWPIETPISPSTKHHSVRCSCLEMCLYHMMANITVSFSSQSSKLPVCSGGCQAPLSWSLSPKVLQPAAAVPGLSPKTGSAAPSELSSVLCVWAGWWALSTLLIYT